MDSTDMDRNLLKNIFGQKKIFNFYFSMFHEPFRIGFQVLINFDIEWTWTEILAATGSDLITLTPTQLVQERKLHHTRKVQCFKILKPWLKPSPNSNVSPSFTNK